VEVLRSLNLEEYCLEQVEEVRTIIREHLCAILGTPETSFQESAG